MLRWRSLLALIVVSLALAALPRPALAAPASPVLAFYYPWYNKGDFDRSRMWDVPASPYNSDDRATIELQVREASGAGITGFISSWMGSGNRTDHNFATLLDVSKGTSFASTIYFESSSFGSPQEVVDNLRYFMSTYGSNPNLSKVGGKPAIFFWNPGAIGSLSTWKTIRSQVDPQEQWHWNVETDRPDSWLDVFDGVHLFSAASWTGDATATYKSMRTKVDAASARTGERKFWAAGVAPGWDNSREGSPTPVLVSRSDGAYYSQRWDSAIASNPDIITVTSWSEWGEGTEIEPGTSYGTLYLDITRQKTSTLKASSSQTLAVANQPLFAFKLGFKALAGQVPDVVGSPIENEHSAANGDSLQMTTNGLMVWRGADNWTAFTDGSRTWVNGPNGVQSRANDDRFSWESQ
jgi:hypothetical protein